MVTRRIPWKGMDVAQIIIAVAQKNTRLEVPPDTDPILKKIIQGVWRSAPDKRYIILSFSFSLAFSLASFSRFRFSHFSFSFFITG